MITSCPNQGFRQILNREKASGDRWKNWPMTQFTHSKIPSPAIKTFTTDQVDFNRRQTIVSASTHRQKTSHDDELKPKAGLPSPKLVAKMISPNLKHKIRLELQPYPRWVITPPQLTGPHPDKTESNPKKGLYSMPSERAQQALKSDKQINVSVSEDRIAFLPRHSKKQGLIIYPGAMVDFKGYAAIARQFAKQGYTTVIVNMPNNMILAGSKRADNVIQEFPAVEAWAVAGHSLGGAMARKYLNDNPHPKLKGIAFWASFPFLDMAKKDLETVFIQCSRDNLLGKHIFYDFNTLMPEGTPLVEIEGGNHSQFGDYGLQFPDLPATISREDQQKAIVDITTKMLNRMKIN